MRIAAFIFFLFISTAIMAQSTEQKGNTLRHVVLVKFKSTSTEKDVESVIKDFTNLKAAIRQIKSFEWGLNNSPENLNEGLTHAFLLTFGSEKDRDDYLIHPDHKKFGDTAGKHFEKVVVVDYWTK